MKGRKIYQLVLCFIFALSMIFALAACMNEEDYYTKGDVDALVADLEAELSTRASETNAAISALKAEYEATKSVLEATAKANTDRIVQLTVDYNVKVAALEKADKDNADEIAALKLSYETELAKLQAADEANASKITDLTNAYNAKVEALEKADKDNADEIAALKADYEAELAKLKAADEANSAKITELTNAYNAKVKELEDNLKSSTDTINILIGELKECDEATAETIKAMKTQIEMILSAMEKQYHTVTFVTGEGSVAPEKQSIVDGKKATKPADPTKKGYIFDGWYVDGEKWSFVGFVVTEDIELIATWSECVNHLDENEDRVCDKCGAEVIPTDVYYSDFGAKGDGVTDDFFAIKACHEYANLYGCTVHADRGATYYIGNYVDDRSSAVSIEIQTDTNWHGCTFIFDDSVVAPYSTCFNSSIFSISPSTQHYTVPASERPTKFLAMGSLDLGGWAPGIECLVYIENSNSRHYIRYGLNADNGSAQHEILHVYADGTLDPDTPLQWDYEEITSMAVYPIDTTPITITGGDGGQRATVKTIFNGARSLYTYYQRNIKITRSNVTLQNIDHIVEGEIPEAQGGTGAPYAGFTQVSYAHNVTVKNMLIHRLQSYSLETNMNNRMGSYEISATHANNVLWKNVTQDVFFDSDGGVSFNGIMGTNYCKNLTFDGNFLCSFDAHCGVYNGTIKNTTIEHINFIGDGLITIENCTVYVDGGSCGINLRSDYGSWWKGDAIFKDVEFKYETRKNKTISLFSSAWTNHDFGYTTYLPNQITLDNVKMLGFTVTVDKNTGYRDEKIVETNVKELYLFSPSIYRYTNVDIGDPNADLTTNPNDWVKCSCTRFNDTDGDGRCNNTVTGSSGQRVWCWGFEETPDNTVNANPYIGTKKVIVINGDTSKPLNIIWPTTPQFKDMDVIVDGVLIIEGGQEVY